MKKDYDFNLPEELLIISKPKFKIGNNILTVYNRPFWDDWFFLIFVSFALVYMTAIQKLSFNNPYVVFFLIILFICCTYCFSLNKVTISFTKNEFLIKNYNPFINIYRRIFQMPFSIKFSDIEKILSDRKYVAKGPDKYFTVLQTDAPYKFRIAIIENEDQSIIFSDYLNKIVKHDSIHADAVSDTTVLN